MEAVVVEDKPKQLASFSAPPPQHSRPQPQPQPPPPHPHPPDAPHGLRPPPGPYDPSPTWAPRPAYPPYEGTANPEQQRGGPPYSAPPRENAPPHPPPEMLQRHGSVSGGARPPPDGNVRPVNGDGSQSMPPGPPPPPQGDYRARMPYPPPAEQQQQQPHPNGEPLPHGMPVMHQQQQQQHPDGTQTPLAHRQYPPPPPHTPLSQPGAYDPGGYFVTQGTGPFSSRPRRTTRAQQACDQCRARKARCDEGRPSCSHCKESNVQCVYKDVPPHKHERATQMVLDKLQEISDRLNVVDDVWQAQSDMGEALNSLLGKDGFAGFYRKDASGQPPATTTTATATTTPAVTETKDSVPAPVNTAPAESFPTTSDPSAERKQVNSGGTKDEKGQEDDIPDDEELSIPIEHTTAAHKLLWWPSIQKLLPEKIDDDYVMQLEESRGPIRPYGRGENDHDLPGFGGHAGSPAVTSGSPQEDPSNPALSPETRFGTGLEFYKGHSPREPNSGGLNTTGNLNLDPDTIRLYYDTYLKNMHVLHPFLGLQTLEEMVGNFTRKYGAPKRTVSAQFVHPTSSDPSTMRVPKRKRSVDVPSKFSAGLESPTSSSDHSASGTGFVAIHRSMENAIVLLVLALGAICSWRREIPGPIQDPPSKSSIFAPLAGVSPTMAEALFPNSTTPFHSPTDNFGGTPGRRQSTHATGSNPGYPDPSDRTLKNMDVIPGMGYYAIASDILGNLQGGNDLPHAQACLLGALYTGQLAHPFSSHGWISQAARACQVLVRPRRFDKMPDGPIKDLICFVYWTCLQLESDILAELDLPASGISRLEGRMGFPKGIDAHCVPNEIESPITKMMYYYLAQIHLRKVLNRVHTDLYKAEKQNPGERKPTWSTSIQETLSFNLEQWRAGLPAHMKWDDQDPPANDINVARLRAKYYGARYIIHRPLLHHALHPMAPRPQNQTAAESPALSAVSSAQSHVSPGLAHIHQAEAMDRMPSDMGPPPRINSSQDPQPPAMKDLETKVLEACVTCIEAAVNSTVAFDGIDGRPVVTNIFGTAHAQFGNMLVLSATYTSKLSSLISADRLKKLFDRTIHFLWQNRYISPTLRKDAEILSLIRTKLFDKTQATTTSSFSSGDG